MGTRKKLKGFNDGSLFSQDEVFYFEDVDGKSEPFLLKKEAEDAYYLKQADDYLGSAIRDNTREAKISIGKQIDLGTWEEAS